MCLGGWRRFGLGSGGCDAVPVDLEQVVDGAKEAPCVCGGGESTAQPLRRCSNPLAARLPRSSP